MALAMLALDLPRSGLVQQLFESGGRIRQALAIKASHLCLDQDGKPGYLVVTCTQPI